MLPKNKLLYLKDTKVNFFLYLYTCFSLYHAFLTVCFLYFIILFKVHFILSNYNELLLKNLYFILFTAYYMLSK